MAGEVERAMARRDHPLDLELAQPNGGPEHDQRLTRLVGLHLAFPESSALGADVASIGCFITDFKHHRGDDNYRFPIAVLCIVQPIIWALAGGAVGGVIGAACKGAKDLAQDDFQLDSFIKAVWITGAAVGGAVGFMGCCYVQSELDRRVHQGHLNEARAIALELANPTENSNMARLRARHLHLQDEIFFHTYRPPFDEDNYVQTEH